MSDQNQWPKPGETTPEGGANGNPPEQPQQYGASAPEAPVPSDPWATSGQGTAAQGASNGQSAPQYPAGAPSQNGGQPGYGAPQNPYAAPQQNPYGQQQQPQPNPYAAPQQNPYGQQQNPYGQQQQNPYAQSTQPSNPYAQQNPYAAPGAYATNGYQPYAQRPKTNVLAILSIVFAFGGVIIWPLIILTSPAGAIMGHIALGKIRQSGEAGRGLALAGVIGGWIMTGLFILIVALVWIGFAASGSGSGGSYDYNYDSGSGAFIA